MRIQRALLGVALLSLVSCSVPAKTFFVDAVDFEDKRVKCLVVIDSDWPGKDTKNIYYTPAEIPVPFKSKIVYMQVKPASVDADGKVVGIPKENDPSEFKSRGRDVQLNYPSKIKFILESR